MQTCLLSPSTQELGLLKGDSDEAGPALLRALGVIGVLELELPQVGEVRGDSAR